MAAKKRTKDKDKDKDINEFAHHIVEALIELYQEGLHTCSPYYLTFCCETVFENILSSKKIRYYEDNGFNIQDYINDLAWDQTNICDHWYDFKGIALNYCEKKSASVADHDYIVLNYNALIVLNNFWHDTKKQREIEAHLCLLNEFKRKIASQI